MKVIIGTKTYTDIDNLSFAPETNLAGTRIPVNEFWVDVLTADTDIIREGTDIVLEDDQAPSNLWAKYWIVETQNNVGGGYVRICAQSKIALLDRKKLAPVIYDEEPIQSVLQTIFSPFLSGGYGIDQVFQGATISGYCPEQTARERLLWVCFVLGAYVATYFSDMIYIISINGGTIEVPDEDPIDMSAAVSYVPPEKIYWKPSVYTSDYVTSIKVISYAFTQGSPASTDEYVAVGSTYYIVSKQEHSIALPNIPASVPPNEIIISDCMLVNDDNVNDILNNLAQYYFNRTRVTAKIVNNAEYYPGDRIMLQVNENGDMMEGIIESCNFQFGMQSASTVKLIGLVNIASGNLTIIYKHGTMNLNKKKYNFPVGYEYDIENPYIDQVQNNHRYIYRPENDSATGTIAIGDNTNTQDYDIALDLDQKTKILHIISVDDVSPQDISGIVIAAIDGPASSAGYIPSADTEPGGTSGETGSGSGSGGSGSGSGTSGTTGSTSGTTGSTSGTTGSTGSGSGSARTLSSISITHMPYYTAFGYPNKYDWSGLEITAKYSDGHIAIVTNDCTVNPANNTSVTVQDYANSPLVRLEDNGLMYPNKTVTVSYAEGGVTKTTSFTVRLYDASADTLTRIEVLNSQYLDSYRVGSIVNFKRTSVGIQTYYTSELFQAMGSTDEYSYVLHYNGTSDNYPGVAAKSMSVRMTPVDPYEFAASDVGTKTFTISVTDNGVTKSDTFTVTVTA